MRQTENFKLSLFDGSDPVSMAAMNANMEAVDAALRAQSDRATQTSKDNAEQFELRAKIATGSYVGTTATKNPQTFYDASGKAFTQNFGAAVNSEKDVTISLDFVPKVFHVAASRSAYVSWSGRLYGELGYEEYGYYTATLTGHELQAAKMTAYYGSELTETYYACRYPAKISSGSSDRFRFYYTTPGASSVIYSGDFGPYPFMTRVTFTENDDGTCTVTIHGADSTRGTENYLDIEGMTYHWVAIG